MKGLMLLLVIAIFLGAALMVRPASASFSFDESTETTCSGNVCTKTLYSGYSPTFFENVIKKSSNWLKFYNVVYLEKDSNFNLELTSFNDTNFIVHLNIPLSQSNKQIPLKFCSEIGCSNVSILMNVLSKDVTVGMNPLLLSNITFGFASTTIKINDNTTGNLGDTYIYSAAGTSNYGTAENLNFLNASAGSGQAHPLIKFNITLIPDGVTINNASLWLYYYNKYLDSGEGYWAGTHHLYNQTWEEIYPTWNNFATLGSYNATTESDRLIEYATAYGWYNWTVTNMVSKSYSDGYDNVSIYFIVHDRVGSPSTSDPSYFASRQRITTTQRPYLNITYTETAPDSTPPTYSNNMTNSTTNGTANQHDLKWIDNYGLSGYIFSFDNCTGTLANNTWVSMSGATNWSNVTKTVNSTLGCTIRWCVYANDTSNNWNATSCSTPFNYVTTAAPSVFSATFNIKTKELLNLPGRVILFGRFLNTNPKTNDTFSRMISAERTFNAKEKTSNTFSALLVAGLQTFERFMNIGTKAADSFFYMITGMRFLNVQTKDANQFSRTIIVTKFLNVSTKDKINFLRNTIVEKFLNISQKESNQFSRTEIISRLLNIQERMNVSWLSQLPYNIFERLLSIPLNMIDKFIVYVRIWEQPSIYQVCSILQQIGDSRAYLCIYATGDWKILIRGV